jgi:16S rRNA (guanine527-N7)-methyltransferase
MMNKQLEEFLSQSIAENSYDVPFAAQQQLALYLDLLQRWNQVFNLTAIRDAYDMVPLHILDSFSISPYLQGSRIIDVGTGAGLPGIPLALTHPGKDFVLLDSNNKKTRFLTQVKMELGIKNIEVVQARCEEYPTVETQKAGFDCIVSRAFSSIAVMLTSTQHLLAENGQFVAMKGVYPEQEIRDIPAGFTVTGVHKLEIKGLAAERHVVCIQRK